MTSNVKISSETFVNKQFICQLVAIKLNFKHVFHEIKLHEILIHLAIISTA